MVVLEEGAISYERGTPFPSLGAASVFPRRESRRKSRFTPLGRLTVRRKWTFGDGSLQDRHDWPVDWWQRVDLMGKEFQFKTF